MRGHRYIFFLLFLWAGVSVAQPSRLAGVRLAGVTVLDSLEAAAVMDLPAGSAFSEDRVESGIDRLLRHYESIGYVFATAEIAEFTTEGDAVGLTIAVQEGARPRLAEVQLAGLRSGFAARLAGLQPGEVLTGYDPEEVQRRIERAGLYREVSRPVLVPVTDSTVAVRIPTGGALPGAFDLVIGYLPGEAGARGSFVGSGQIDLRNLMGAGRRVSARLNRMPGQTSELRARLTDPFVAGWPVSLSAWFDGFQRDSTYEQRRMGMDVGHLFGNGIELFVTVSRDYVRPGPSGVRLNQEGSQEIARGEGTFLGLGIRANTAGAVFPRRGITVELVADHGRRDRSQRQVSPGADTVRARTSVLQDRLRMNARAYVPVVRRQVWMIGADASVVASDQYDPSDLVYFGGAATLRGYDENRFQGRAVGRLTTEYRYRLEQASYAFLFLDLGYIERPRAGSLEPLRGWYPGYGFGASFETPAGLIQVTYAMSPEGGPTAGRVHAGLTFGL